MAKRNILRRIALFLPALLAVDASGDQLSSSLSSKLPDWLQDAGTTTTATRLERRQLSSQMRELQSIAEDSCIDDALQNEAVLREIGLECRCRPVNDGVVLMCADECAYCNDAGTVCGVQSAQALYNERDGSRTSLGGVFQYLTGFDDTIAIENTGCVEQNQQIISCQDCSVYVNGKECNSCELVTCPDGGQAEVINCENIERGAQFDFCGDVSIDENSVFTALSTNQFEECLPLDILGSRKGSKKGGKGSKKRGYSDETFVYQGPYAKSAKKAKTRRRRLISDRIV